MAELVQQLLFCDDSQKKALYHKGSYLTATKNSIDISEKRNVTFDTFFNSFSIKKWKKYTSINSLSFEVSITGSARVSINEAYFVNAQTYREKEVSSYTLTGESTKKILVPIKISGDADIIFVKIAGGKDECILHNGRFIIGCSRINSNINLAIGVCTYKREQYIINNLERLQNSIFGAKSPYKDYFKVFVADNGHSLNYDELNNDYINVFPNNNLGGTGGFTRCMLEAVLNKTNFKKYSHMVLMDDDITFEPESLIRLFCWLSALKIEYRNSMVAFSMFTEENPCVQYTKGKLREENTSKCLKANLNLSFIKNVLLNETETVSPNFSGWWCHCIPTSYITPDNLPFPFFIRCDDTEYGCRYNNVILTLNGICVWHPSFEGKHPISISYYDMRNNLIFMTENINQISQKLVQNELFYAYKNALYMEYDKALLAMRGIEDFLKGPSFLHSVDYITLNDEIRKYNYKNVEPPKNKRVLLDFLAPEKFANHAYETLSFLQLMPAFRTKYINYDKRKASLVNVRRLYCYNIETKQGYYINKSLIKYLKCKLKYNALMRSIDKNFAAVVQQWRNEFKTFTTVDFWVSKLGLERESYVNTRSAVPVQTYSAKPIIVNNDGTVKKIIKRLFPWYTKLGAFLRKIKTAPHFTIRSDIGMYFEFIRRNFLKTIGLSFLDKNMRDMRKLKNIHSGERCFITCTGPSLTVSDLEMLKDEYTFGVNSITKAYPMTNWRPTYYVLVDAYAYGEILSKEEVFGGKFCKEQAFLHYRIHPKTKIDNAIYCPVNYSNHWGHRMKKGIIKICDDPAVGVFDAFTVTNMAITIAAYMGFKDIYIIGADATYKLDKTHFVEGEWEKKHKKAQKGLALAVQRSMIAYWRIKEHYNKKGINIYNATRGGMLEIFPRVNLDEVISNEEENK